MKTHRSVARSVGGLLAGATLGLALVPAAATAQTAKAPAKQFLTVARDEVGDAPNPSKDIWESIARYKNDGSILFVVTLSGPVDPVGNDAGIIVSLGTGPGCTKPAGLGIGLLSDPGVVEFAAISTKQKKISNGRRGRGQVTNNVFTFLVKHPSIAGWDPTCYSIALVDPDTAEDEAPVFFDQTGEVKLAPRPKS